MSIIIAVWIVAGIVCGVLHASGIRHTSQRPSAWSAITGMLRIACVGALLVAAAMLGGILPAAAGWMIGFFATIVVTLLLPNSDSLQHKS